MYLALAKQAMDCQAIQRSMWSARLLTPRLECYRIVRITGQRQIVSGEVFATDSTNEHASGAEQGTTVWGAD